MRRAEEGPGLVGRERELALIEQAYERALHERRFHLFTLLGSAGVGKSRLVQEFLRSHEPEARVLQGRCLPYGEGITFFPLFEMVEDAAKLSINDSPEAVRAKIATLIEGEKDAHVVADGVAQLIGISDVTGDADETFWALRKLLEALATRGPLVIVFDDIHWAESTLLDLIDHIGRWSSDFPMLCVCLARPELIELRPAWGGGKLNASAVLLEPLDDSNSRALVSVVLGGHGIEPSVVDRITEAAGGNPLFVEEMISMLVEQGVLVRANGQWETDGELAEVSAPPTIQALLATRIDSLELGERVILQLGSVCGKVWPRSAVTEMAPEIDLAAHLDALIRKDLIAVDTSQFGDDQVFRFRHLLIRDAAYNSLPKERRAELHELYAEWLDRKTGDRAREFAEIIGYHFEQAHKFLGEVAQLDQRGEDLAVRAAERLLVAGRRALGRGDASGTISLLRRAASLWPREHLQRNETLILFAEALIESGELARAGEVLAEAAVQAAAAEDERTAVYVTIERSFLGLLASPGGWAAKTVGETARVIPVLERLEDHHGLARARRLEAHAHWMSCRIGATEQAVVSALEHARRAGDGSEIRSGLTWLARVAWFGPTPAEEGLIRCRQILEDGEGDRKVEAAVLSTSAVFHAMRGDFETARTMLGNTKAILGDLGLTLRLAATSHAESYVEMLAGDPGAAEEVLKAGFQVLEGMGEKSFLSTLAAFLAHALVAQDKVEEAGRFVEICRDAAGADDVASQAISRSAQAKVFARRGDKETALILAREATALMAPTDSITLKAEVVMDLARVLAEQNRPAEAAAAAQEALGLYRAKGNAVAEGRANIELAALV